MAYEYQELNSIHKSQLINFLYSGFSRSKKFWSKSINNLIDYQNSVNEKKIGYGLFYDNKLVGAILIINDKSTKSASLTSLYVMKDHRARSLSFLKKAVDSIGQDIINDFSATDDAIKIFKIFGFKTYKKSCNIRVPMPFFSRIDVKKLNEKEAKKILTERNIFLSKNLRVLEIINGDIKKHIILKDLSILKNDYLRVLSCVICSSSLEEDELKSVVFYNSLRGKILFDFFDPDLAPSYESKRFRIISKGLEEFNYYGNSEYLLFDF